jgi:tetratricopeptide (TPR) repeat protein
LSLKEAKELVDTSESLSPEKYADDPRSLTSLFQNLLNLGVKRLEKEDFEAAYVKAFEEKDYLDAALILSEYSFQTGEDLSVGTRKIEPYRETDKLLKQFLVGLNTSNRESIEKAIPTLLNLPREGLTRGYIIDVMLGDARVAFGDISGAQTCFVKALESNPYMAAVYKDLGDSLLITQNLDRAWDCYLRAQELCPNHKILKEIQEKQDWMTRTFPEFF